MRRWTAAKISFYLLLAGLILLRAQFLPQASPVLEAQVGQTIELAGWIDEEPRATETSLRLVVKTVAGDRLIAYAPPFGNYGLGDRVKARGLLAKPEAFATDSGKDFDYPSWLAVRGIFYELDRPTVEVLKPAERHALGRTFLAIKNFFLTRVEKILPEPESSLLGGLLLGVQRPLGPTLNNDLRRTSLSHMVVLSGYNLTVVAEALRAVLRGLPLAWNLSVAAVGIVVFALIAGGGAAASRAALMALIAILARATGRLYDASRALLVVVYLMSLWNPRLPLFDLGFQLSVLATLGLIHLSPLVEKKLQRLPRLGGLKEVLIATLAAQLGVLPWILYRSGQLSLVGPLINPLVLIVVPLIMLGGLIASSLAIASAWLAFPFTLLTHWLLAYQLTLIHWFAHWPLASVNLPAWPLALTLLLYALIGWWYYRERRNLPHPNPPRRGGEEKKNPLSFGEGAGSGVGVKIE